MKANRFFLLVLLAGAMGPAARAAILQDFNFNEALGTAITSAANDASPGNNFLAQSTSPNMP